MINQRNFEEEREQARQEAERLTTILQAHGYEVGAIDWQRAGRLAYVPVNGVEVGDLITLTGSARREDLFYDVRYKLLEAMAQKDLQNNASAASWSPLDMPADAPGEMKSLWRVHLGEEERPGVNIAEVVRDGKRLYEVYPGGPQFSVHFFYVDKVTARAMQIIREAGGTVTYQPAAHRSVGFDLQKNWLVLPHKYRPM